MRFSRTHILRRCLLSSAVLAASSVGSSAWSAEDGNFLEGLITGRKATSVESQRATESSTVQAELQKLFHAGQVQTSEHIAQKSSSDVQKVQYETTEGGLLRQIFGDRPVSQRRAERIQQRAARQSTSNRNPSVPKPPPIDYRMPSNNRGLNAQSVSFGKEVPEPPSVPPVGVAMPQPTPGVAVGLKPGQVSHFVSPFIDDESLERDSEILDLDSLIERPVELPEAAPITTDDVMVEDMVEFPREAQMVDDETLLEVSPSSVFPPDDSMQQDVIEIEEQPLKAQAVTSTTEAVQVRLDEMDNVVDTEGKIEVRSESIEVKIDSESESVLEIVEEATQASEAQVDVTAEEGLESVKVDAESTEEVSTETKSEVSRETVGAQRQAIQSERARREQQRYLILSRAGRAGFKGFCPVALRETRTLRDSSQTHSAKFGLKTYHFSSEEARLRFEADPARYAPAAGGCDVVLLANTGEAEEGSLDFCLWYRDRLYMFRSRETQAIFSGDPARFANQY